MQGLSMADLTAPATAPTTRLTLVTGPPCGGKTHHATTHATPGDVVIDYDLIAQALGSPDPHDHPRALHLPTLAAMRAVQRAANAHVWLVKCDPSAADVAAATETVLIDPGIDVCLARARAERPARWERLIRDWYAVHEIRGAKRVGGYPGPVPA